MNEQEWEKVQYFAQYMVWTLLKPGKIQRTKAGKRNLRLFACGCCRLIWDLLTDSRARKAVQVAEEFAEGRTGKTELQAVYEEVLPMTADGYFPTEPSVEQRIALDMATNAAHAKAVEAAFYMTACSLPLAGCCIGEMNGEAILCHLLRCVFGNPFQPQAIDASWLRWRSGTIPKLAEAVYEERAFDRLPILADGA